MKKILALVLLACTIVSCEKTQEDILREMIEKRLETTMHNPKSYEFVSMSPVDSIMSEFKDDKNAILIEMAIKAQNSERKILWSKVDAKYVYSINERISFTKQIEEKNKKIDSLLVKYSNMQDSYVPHLTGYYTIFNFRGQNKFGALVLNSYKVIFNKELTEISEMKEVE